MVHGSMMFQTYSSFLGVETRRAALLVVEAFIAGRADAREAVAAALVAGEVETGRA